MDKNLEMDENPRVDENPRNVQNSINGLKKYKNSKNQNMFWICIHF